MKSEKGAVMVLVALLAVFLVGMAAVAVDAGVLVVNKRTLQVAADLAALAGAQELPNRPDEARAVAIAVLSANNVKPGEIGTITVARDNTELEVTVSRSVGLYLARVFGYTSSEMSALSRARVEGVSTVNSLVPWGVDSEEPYEYGLEYTLKWNADNHDPPLVGNYHIVNLSGDMTPQEYTDWIANDYTGDPITVGQLIPTKTGNLTKQTVEGVTLRMERAAGYDCEWPDISADCPLIVIVPVVHTFVDAKGFGHVEVVGFARFLITRLEDAKSQNLTVYGIFLERLEDLTVDPSVRNFAMKRVFLVR